MIFIFETISTRKEYTFPHTCKGVGVRFAGHFISFFLNITEIKLFHFHRIFKNGGGGGGGGEGGEGFERTP